MKYTSQRNADSLLGFADKLLCLIEQQQGDFPRYCLDNEPIIPVSSKSALWLIAYSGGVDSHVLLHQVVEVLRDPQFQQRLKKKSLILPQLEVIHVDHGLQSCSVAWVNHCQKICDGLGLILHVGRIELDVSTNVEAEARRARYQFFSKVIMQQHNSLKQLSSVCLFLGQHQQDQVETFLYRLVRGAGLRGLQGIPEKCLLSDIDSRFNKPQELSNTHVIRPLLAYSQVELLRYAKLHQLNWVEDPSNQETHYDRNFIRQSVIPIMQKRWPKFQSRLIKNMEFLEQSQAMLDELARMDIAQSYALSHCMAEESSLTQQSLHITQFELDEPVFPLDYFHTISEGKSRCLNSLQYWLREQSDDLSVFLQLTQTQQEQLMQSVFSLKNSTKPTLFSFSAVPFELRQFKQALYLLPKQLNLKEEQASQCWSGGELVWGNARYIVECDSGENVLSELKFEVRPKPVAETMQVNAQQRQLKKLLQEAAVPPWRRSDLPYIYIRGELVAVANILRSDILVSFKIRIQKL